LPNRKRNLAESQSPFTFSNGAQDVGSDGASYLQNSEDAVGSTIGDVSKFGYEIFGVVSTILDIADAYGSCS
jgi:hypothetical protein